MIGNKLRVWDRKGRSMHYATEHHNGKGFGTLVFGFDRPFCSDDYILMYSSGLKDENGGEIYEDDIICDSFVHWVHKRVELTPEFFHEYMEYGLENARIKVTGNVYENQRREKDE
jgi:uncharacterized phage protein (TIGR01671 family)